MHHSMKSMPVAATAPATSVFRIKSVWHPAVALAAILMAAISVNAAEPGKQSQEHFSKTITTRVDLGYLLHLPNDYAVDAGRQWPLMLFLHGAGERGDDLSMVERHGPPKMAAAGDSPSNIDLPFILVSPQCPAGERWNATALVHLIDHIQASHRVDPRRIYVTGLSMGGYGTWDLITNYPEKFAAAAPICGGGDPISILLARREKRENISALPIWNFHGAQDTVVPPKRSEVMVEAIARIGGNIRYTVYPDAGHDSWTATYDNADLYQWFLSHARP